MYRPACLDPFPADLADSLLAMALDRSGLVLERMDGLTDDETLRLDEVTWRRVTAADVSDMPCDD